MKDKSAVFSIMQKEFTHIFRDKILLMIALVAPFALMFLCGFLYIEGKVTALPAIVFDQDQSEMSRMIIRSFADSERFQIKTMAGSYAEVEKALQREAAYLAVVIPPDLKQKVKSGRGAEIGLIMNAGNLVIMNTAANAANQIIQTLSAGITMRVMQANGISKVQAYQGVTALSFRTRNWYNPTTSYLVFMLLGLIGTIIQQVTFLGVALAFVREKEQRTWGRLIISRLSWTEVMGGKLLVYLIIYTFDILASFALAIGFFGLPMRGSAWLLILTSFLFILVLLALGMAISILVASAAQAIEISMLIAVPSFLISGYTWPYLSMPAPIQFLSRILPLSHYLEAVKAIVYMDAGWEVVWPKLAVLALFAIIFLPLTAVALNRRLTLKKFKYSF
ncbi:MAG: ABC transporter permease [Bacteroidota bacterium]